MKTDDVGTEEYRGDDWTPTKEDITITGETVVKPDVPMYYDLAFEDCDPDYSNWAKSYETIVDPKRKVQDAIKKQLPTEKKIKPITNVIAQSASSRPDHMDGDPDYANFGRVYDELRKKEVAHYSASTDRIVGDPDYANFQKAYDRIVNKYA